MLRRLDGATLAPKAAVQLGRPAGGSHLGPARGHPRRGDGVAPMAALIRFQNGMTEGTVSVVDVDGTASALPGNGVFEPRDVEWLGGQLLASDGKSFSLLRWDAAGGALPTFGDDALRDALRSRAAERHDLRAQHERWLLAAGAAFGIGLLLALLARRREQGDAPAALDLSKLGTPIAGWRALGALQARAWWPAVLPMLLAIVPTIEPFKGQLMKTIGPLGLVVLLGTTALLLLLAMPLFMRRLRRLAADPRYEPMFNVTAMNHLRTRGDAVARLLRDGEQVLETFMLSSLRPTWMVLTGERLFAFKVALLDHKLDDAHQLGDVIGVSTDAGGLLQRADFNRLTRRANPLGGWLEIALADGRVLAGAVQPPGLAKRVAERIAALAPSARAAAQPRERKAVAAQPGIEAERRRRAIASALVPGLGQWQQGRPAMALLWFVPWLAMMLFATIPMLWTLIEPYAGVPPRWAAAVFGITLLLAVGAASDAWRMTGRASAGR